MLENLSDCLSLHPDPENRLVIKRPAQAADIQIDPFWCHPDPLFSAVPINDWIRPAGGRSRSLYLSDKPRKSRKYGLFKTRSGVIGNQTLIIPPANDGYDKT
jgi:hypothetical protein